MSISLLKGDVGIDTSRTHPSGGLKIKQIMTSEICTRCIVLDDEDT